MEREKIYLQFKDKLKMKNDIYPTTVLPSNLSDNDVSLITRNEDHYFLQFNFNKSKKSKRQGFKIHISATTENYQKILNIVYLFCKKRNISFKYISNTQELIKNLSGNIPSWNAGKFITIYPQSNEFEKNITELYELSSLKHMKGIFILSDRRFKDSNVIFYRYGIIKSENQNIYDNNGKYLYTDRQQLGYKLPSFVKEPFPINKDSKSKHSKYIFKTIFPLSVIHSKAASSVYLVKLKDNKKVYILKNARLNFSDGEETQIDRLKKEEDTLNKLSTFSFFPQIIDSFSENENYFLLETKKPGVTVDDYRAEEVDKFISNRTILPRTENAFKIIKDMCFKLHVLHKNDIFLGDVSANNVLIDKINNKISFVDVEQTQINISKVNLKRYLRTPGFYDDKTSSLPPLEQDIQQLGYVIISMFCRANDFLQIDDTNTTTINFFRQYAKEYKLPTQIVDFAIDLVKKHNEQLLVRIQSIDLKINEEAGENNFLFPQKLLNGLSKSILCASIDGFLNEIDNPNLELDDIYDALFGNKTKILFELLLKNNLCITFKTKKVIIDTYNKLFSECKNGFDSQFQKLDFSIF